LVTVLNILFVCTGNTCRSVMAQGLFEKMWNEFSPKKVDIKAYSAGVGAVEGINASREALEILRDEGMDLSHHRSSKVTAELIEKAHYIFTMTRIHKEILLNLYPEAREKIWLFPEFAGMNGREISDPYGLGMEKYRLVAGEIKEALKEIIARLNVVEGKDITPP